MGSLLLWFRYCVIVMPLWSGTPDARQEGSSLGKLFCPGHPWPCLGISGMTDNWWLLIYGLNQFRSILNSGNVFKGGFCPKDKKYKFHEIYVAFWPRIRTFLWHWCFIWLLLTEILCGRVGLDKFRKFFLCLVLFLIVVTCQSVVITLLTLQHQRQVKGWVRPLLLRVFSGCLVVAI